MGSRLLNCRRYPGWGPLRHAGGTLPDQTGSRSGTVSQVIYTKFHSKQTQPHPTTSS